MLKKILIGISVLLAGLLTYVAFLPSEMLIARELVINATPEVIFPHINNTKLANDWMPWKEIDPGAQPVNSGPEEGIGAKSSWDSKGQMGTGEALVVESVPNQVVKTKLTYTKPMQMEQLAEVTLIPSAEGTLVRWAVTGENSFLGKLMCLFMNVDKEVGGHFEMGLNNLKNIVEGTK